MAAAIGPRSPRSPPPVGKQLQPPIRARKVAQGRRSAKKGRFPVVRMGGSAARQRFRVLWLVPLAVLALATTAATAYVYFGRPVPYESPLPAALSRRAYASGLQTQYFCTRCHAYPHADIF